MNSRINKLNELKKRIKFGDDCLRKPLEKRRKPLLHAFVSQTFNTLALEEQNSRLTAETFSEIVFNNCEALVAFNLREHIKNECLSRFLQAVQTFVKENEFPFDYQRLSALMLNPDPDPLISTALPGVEKDTSLMKKLENVKIEYFATTRNEILSANNADMDEIDTVIRDYIEALKAAIDGNKITDLDFDRIVKKVTAKLAKSNPFQRLDSEDRELLYGVFSAIAGAVDQNNPMEF